MKKKSMHLPSRKDLASAALMFVGAYAFIMGFDDGKWFMYIVGVALFAAAYLIRRRK